MEIPRAQWNSTFQLQRPDPSHCAFGYCSCKQDTKEQYWGQQFCQMERDFSVQPTEMTRPVKEDHLQSWSQIFWLDQTKMVLSFYFDVPTNISGILGWMESAPDCILFFLLINLLLSVFKKLFQCYIQEGKHKAVVIGPRASTYSVFPQQSWKINRYKKSNSKSGAVFSSARDSICPWCPPVLQCNYLIIYNCFGCDRYYAVGEVVVTSKEELAIAQQSLIEV